MANHPDRSIEIRPREHLRAVADQYPQAWKQYDMFRADRGKDLPDWPVWCYAPVAAAYAVVSGGGMLNPNAVGDIAKLAALSAWRTTQTIYRFDPAMARSLIETPISRLPSNTLLRLPEWCVYIEAPELSWLGNPLAGFFAHLESDANDDRKELRLLWDYAASDPGELTPTQLHIDHETLDLSLAAALKESKRQMINVGKTMLSSAMPVEQIQKSMIEDLQPVLSMLLYLCSDEADIGSGQVGRPRPKKTKRGWKLFPPDTPSIVDVGYNVGKVLRDYHLSGQQDNNSDRQGPRPHIRKAHWHMYRTGPGRTNKVIKWLSPISVNIGSSSEIPATIKYVKS